MQIENVLVEEILFDEANRSGLVTSTLYTFREPTWVSIYPERGDRRLGPITLLDESDEFSKVTFDKRPLHVDRKSRHLTIFYRDRWTIPPCTVYALVLPKGFIASHIKVGNELLQLGVSHDARLFYHAVFGLAEQAHIVDIEAMIKENPREYQGLLQSPEVKKGTSNYMAYFEATNISLDLLFKLLELGSKLLNKL